MDDKLLPLKKVISGGQTGVDQAALKGAKRAGLETGGVMPKGFKTEVGPQPNLANKFNLKESKSKSYVKRTKMNVDKADGVLAFLKTASGGTSRTIRYAKTKKWESPIMPKENKQNGYRPVYVVDDTDNIKISLIEKFIINNEIKILNVAGHRQSKAPDLAKKVEKVIYQIGCST